MAFNFKKKSGLINATFEREGEKLNMDIDGDALTPNKIKEINDEMREQVAVETGMQMETANALALAKMLDIMIVKWDASDAKPEYKFFCDMGIKLLNDLLKFCMEQINPKKATET